MTQETTTPSAFVELLKNEIEADAIRHQSWQKLDKARSERMKALHSDKTPEQVLELYRNEQELSEEFDGKVQEHLSARRKIERAFVSINQQGTQQ